MAMSTQTLDEGARMLEAGIMLDRLQILDVGNPVTVGTQVTRDITPAGEPVPGLVQTVTLESAVEGKVSQGFTIKVPKRVSLTPGQAVRVEACLAEPDLVGVILLVDTVSLNGAAMLRKATASRARVVNQEGKEALA